MQHTCGQATARIELPSPTIVAGATTTGSFLVDNQTGRPLRLRTARGCQPKWAVSLGNDQIPNQPVFPTDCVRRPLVFPVGESQRSFTLRASCVGRGAVYRARRALPPGQYSAGLFGDVSVFPPVAPVPVTVAGAELGYELRPSITGRRCPPSGPALCAWL